MYGPITFAEHCWRIYEASKVRASRTAAIIAARS